MVEIEGIAGLSIEDIRLFHRDMWSELPAVPGRYGRLAEFLESKTAWMIENGFHMDAAHWLWGFMVSRLAQFEEEPPQTLEREVLRTQRWLHKMGWKRKSLEAKLLGLNEIIGILS